VANRNITTAVLRAAVLIITSVLASVGYVHKTVQPELDALFELALNKQPERTLSTPSGEFMAGMVGCTKETGQ